MPWGSDDTGRVGPMSAVWRLHCQARYLVSLVDAVDELLGRRVPQEVHSGGVHSLCLHVLWGCSRHCSPMEADSSTANGGRSQREKRHKGNHSYHSGFKSNQGADGKGGGCLPCVMMKETKENWSTSHFLWGRQELH